MSGRTVAGEPGALQRSARAYTRLVEDILGSLQRGELRVEDRLPSESQLSEQYGISVNSVRRGLDLLAEDGVLERRHGSGTYIRRVPEVEAPPVPRDTVALIFDSLPVSYHPYFSEQRRGIDDVLRERGWRLWRPAAEGERWREGEHLSHPELDLEALGRELRQGRSFAGAIISAGTATRLFPEGRPPVPVISHARHPVLPFADFDWALETARALAEVMRRGARRLLLVGGPPAEPPDRLARRAAAMLDIPADAAALRAERVAGGGRVSHHVRAAYETTAAALRADPDLDGIVVTSDFEAQGVLDAVAETGRPVPGSLAVAAIINRESRLHTPLPFAAVVLDGYAQGRALGELLEAHIAAPSTAPRQVLLGGSLRLPPA